MIDWEDIRYFIAVAQNGTLSGAARSLKVDHATVSRRLAALETALELRLVDRLPRSCRVTEAGKLVLERSVEMEAGALAIARLATAARVPLSGRVTLSAPPALVTHLLANHLDRFRKQYPHIRLSLSAEGRVVSLSRREADVALRFVQPDEANSVARKIGRMTFSLYAQRSYEHLSTPDLWEFIAWDQTYPDMPAKTWLLGIIGERQVACELTHSSEHLIAAQAGVGVAALPSFMGERDRDLVRIDNNVQFFARDIWLTVHNDLRKVPAIRAVMDFVAATVSDDEFLRIR